MDAESRLKELGIELPPAPTPIGNYVAGIRVGNLLFMSGIGPRRSDGSSITGKLGADLMRLAAIALRMFRVPAQTTTPSRGQHA